MIILTFWKLCENLSVFLYFSSESSKDHVGYFFLYKLTHFWTLQARVAKELIELRNRSVFAFFMCNALFVVIVFLLQLNKDQIHVKWPWGIKTNITYDEESSEVFTVSSIFSRMSSSMDVGLLMEYLWYFQTTKLCTFFVFICVLLFSFTSKFLGQPINIFLWNGVNEHEIEI